MSLRRIQQLSIFPQNGKVYITHVESRKSLSGHKQYQLFLQVICSHDTFALVSSSAKQSPLIDDVKVLEEKEPDRKGRKNNNRYKRQSYRNSGTFSSSSDHSNELAPELPEVEHF